MEKKFYLPSAEITQEMSEWLRALAESENRSVSQQIIHMLGKIKNGEKQS